MNGQVREQSRWHASAKNARDRVGSRKRDCALKQRESLVSTASKIYSSSFGHVPRLWNAACSAVATQFALGRSPQTLGTKYELLRALVTWVHYLL